MKVRNFDKVKILNIEIYIGVILREYEYLFR